MQRKDLTELKRMITWLGFQFPNGRWSGMAFLYITVIAILMTNSVMFLVYTWDDIYKRLDGVKGFVQYLSFLAYFLGLSWQWNYSVLLIDTIESGLYHRSSIVETTLVEQIENDVTRINTIWYYSLKGYIMLAVTAPLLVLIFRFIQPNIHKIKVHMLYLTVPFYFPKSYENLSVYFIAYILESYFTLYAIWNAYVVIVTAFNSMQIIEGELKVLRQSIKRIETFNQVKCQNYKSNQFTRHKAVDLKAFITDFVKRQCHVYRRVNDITKGMQFVSLSINTGIAILMCTTLYKVATKRDFAVIMQEAIYASIQMFGIYCYGRTGENVEIANENLRTALYEYPWVDKPQWFKKSLHLIMSRTTKPVQIQPYGLFVLNLRFVLLTMRSVYSYYNVLSSFK